MCVTEGDRECVTRYLRVCALCGSCSAGRRHTASRAPAPRTSTTPAASDPCAITRRVAATNKYILTNTLSKCIESAAGCRLNISWGEISSDLNQYTWASSNLEPPFPISWEILSTDFIRFRSVARTLEVTLLNKLVLNSVYWTLSNVHISSLLHSKCK